MTPEETHFLETLQGNMNVFKAEIDKRVTRVITSLVSIILALLGVFIAFGFGHCAKDGETRKTVQLLEKKQNYILENAASQKSINDIIITFENQTKAIIKLSSGSNKEAMDYFEEVSDNFRSYILQYESGLNYRGFAELKEKFKSDKKGS